MISLVNTETYLKIKNEIKGIATLVAVSKKQPLEKVKQLFDIGQIEFGENYVQELVSRKEYFAGSNINWHMIGHLQSNKVKMIAPFVKLIQGVDSFDLLKVINKEALKNNRIIDCLIQIHIAVEETKFGFDREEITEMLMSSEFQSFKNIRIRGLMGMATFTDNIVLIRKEFHTLRKLYEEIKPGSHSANFEIDTLSMGMSDDYKIAIEEGSNMIRLGTLIFGSRFPINTESNE